MPSMPPVIKNREWRFLLREFTAAHPKVRSVPNRLLRMVLTPVASVAWWIAKFAPEVLEQATQRGSLQVLLPGVSIEGLDEGRWFAFLPWMLGLSGVDARVYLVGDELIAGEVGASSSAETSRSALQLPGRTPAADAVKNQPPAEIFNGLLGEWREAVGRDVRIDACVLFSPGLVSHHETWMTEEDLLPILRARTPLGFFGYSLMDCLEDQEILALWGIHFEPATEAPNPWRGDHELSSLIGAVAGMAWRCEVASVPETVRLDEEAFEEFQSLMGYLTDDFRDFGDGDPTLERLGARWEVHRQGSPDETDAIIVLPKDVGVLESTGELGQMGEEGFRACDPPIVVPAEVLAARPADSAVMKRVLWAIRTHRDWAGPALDSSRDSDLLFGGMTDEDMREGMREFLSGVLGRDVDPDAFMREMRAQGGAHGPTHPAWHDLFNALGWEPGEWTERPARHSHAFVLRSGGRRLSMPVICEAYAYSPDDRDDELANEALVEVARRYPGGAALLFKSMPYCEVSGHKYQFGGMLWWKQKWTAFALTSRMTSIDDVIDQVEGGFRIGDDDTRYCEDDCSLAVPLNLMCQGMDPNKPGKLLALKSGAWTTVLPG
jgi:hypothetical protein